MATDIENPVEDEQDSDSIEADREWTNLTAFQRDILWVLKKGGEQHGMAVLRSLEDVYGAEINHGRLYPNLDTLDELGYVKKESADHRTNNYSITSEGKMLLDQREWQEGDDE